MKKGVTVIETFEDLRHVCRECRSIEDDTPSLPSGAQLSINMSGVSIHGADKFIMDISLKEFLHSMAKDLNIKAEILL